MPAIPGSVLSGEHLFPGGQPQSRNIRYSGFHAAAMFGCVGALDLDFNRVSTGARCDFKPGIASQLDRIH